MRLQEATPHVWTVKGEEVLERRKISRRSRLKLAPVGAMILLIILASVFCSPISSPDSALAREVKHRFVTIGTGTSSGAYFAVGKAICESVNRRSKRLVQEGATLVTRCHVVPSGGSVFNIRQVASGAFTFVIAQSNVARQALGDTAATTGVAHVPGLRSAFSLHSESLHVVVPADAQVAGLADLAGKRFSPGNFGSGTRQLVLDLAAAHNLPVDDILNVSAVTPDSQVNALCAGTIDAFAMVTAVPAAVVMAAATNCAARLMHLDTSIEKGLADAAPDLAPTVIPSGAYPTALTDTKTLGVHAGLFTRDVVPDQVVRDLIQAVIEELAHVQAAHPALGNLQPHSMATQGLGAPLHDAAAAFFAAEGLL